MSHFFLTVDNTCVVKLTKINISDQLSRQRPQESTLNENKYTLTHLPAFASSCPSILSNTITAKTMSNCPQLRVECIVKLGGSAVTVKDRLETEKLDEIRKIAEFLNVKSQQQQQTAVHSDNNEERHQNKPCILVHGAG